MATIMICDFCGKRIAEHFEHRISAYPPVGVHGRKEFDVCHDCYYDFWELLDEKIKPRKESALRLAESARKNCTDCRKSFDRSCEYIAMSDEPLRRNCPLWERRVNETD